MTLVEACVDSVESAIAAERGGARRLELCDALFDGGTTPSAGKIAAVKSRVSIPVFVIVRPRGGGFVYTPPELDVMTRDIAIAKQLGVDGLVIGALTRDGAVDVTTTRALVDAADATPVTFHRAFDLARDLTGALDLMIALGITRLLTSGGAASALDGVDTIKNLVARAAGRLVVMAGGGIREENVAQVVARGGVAEVHVRGTRLTGTGAAPAPSGIRLRKALPNDEDTWEATDESRIRSLVSLANSSNTTVAH